MEQYLKGYNMAPKKIMADDRHVCLLIGLSDWSHDVKTDYTTSVGDKMRNTISDPMRILY